MLPRVGVFILSLLISNWIYAEALIFVPRLAPFGERIMQVLRLPTHNEWPEIMQSQQAVALGNDIHGAIKASPLDDIFHAVGVTDNKVQGFFRANQLYSFGDTRNGRVVRTARNSKPYRKDAEMFGAANTNGVFAGGYVEFKFPVG